MQRPNQIADFLTKRIDSPKTNRLIYSNRESECSTHHNVNGLSILLSAALIISTWVVLVPDVVILCAETYRLGVKSVCFWKVYFAVMAARRLAASAVDWTAFAERVHPHQMESFRAFRAKSDAFIAKYVTYTMSPGSSGWSLKTGPAQLGHINFVKRG